MGTKIHKGQKGSEWKMFHLLKKRKGGEAKNQLPFLQIKSVANGIRLILQASKGCCKTSSGSRGKFMTRSTLVMESSVMLLR